MYECDSGRMGEESNKEEIQTKKMFFAESKMKMKPRFNVVMTWKKFSSA